MDVHRLGWIERLYFLPLLLSGKNRMHMGTVAEAACSYPS